MRPRNILTETNDMRKLMGLPLINEDGGQTIDDVKKKVLTEVISDESPNIKLEDSNDNKENKNEKI